MATHSPAREAHGFVDKNAAVVALRDSVPDLLRELHAVKDPNAIAVGHWTIRDLAAHLADLFENYRAIALGEGSGQTSSERIADYNEQRVRAITDPLDVLIQRIERS